ncbi:MAG: serine/threonine-protein kinase [Pirellulaceae bacterium]|nr:serine/threonine-protein kinase [Pirellulaceae bacterium]
MSSDEPAKKKRKGASDPSSDSGEGGFDEVLCELFSQRDAEAEFDREQFLERYPEYADELFELLTTADLIKLLAGPTLEDLQDQLVASGQTTDSKVTTEDVLPLVSDFSLDIEQGEAGEGKSIPKLWQQVLAENQSLIHFVTAKTIVPKLPSEVPYQTDKDSSDVVSGPLTTKTESSLQSASLEETLPIGDHPREGSAEELDLATFAKRFGLEPVVSEGKKAFLFGDYELYEIVGHGGMGIVCKAHQRGIDRMVAVKMIRDGRLASGEEIDRFYSEARAAGKLVHPNIVTIYQVGEVDGQHYFSMDYVEGGDLSKFIQEGTLTDREIGEIVRTLARAIAHAHENDILHRDLKPANILLDEKRHVWVTDFGLAKHTSGSAKITMSGTAVGTPSYMSPEQAAGQHDVVSERSDVYSLGAILYEMLTGRPPFKADSVVDTLLLVIHKEVELPRKHNPDVSSDLETICLKCLQKKPNKRYGSSAELADDLTRYLEGEPILARPISEWGRRLLWFKGVPLVAALSGSRVNEPSRGHTIFQWSVLGTLLATFLFFLYWIFGSNITPVKIRLASATSGGLYHQLALDLQKSLENITYRAVETVETKGSVENGHLLKQKKAEAAFLQADTIDSDSMAIVAPLYYEVALLIVRKEGEIRSFDDLAGKKLCLGEEGSGMHLTSQQFLLKANLLGEEVDEANKTIPMLKHFLALEEEEDLDGALVVTGLQNQNLHALLSTGKYKILPFSDSLIDNLLLDDPNFKQISIFSDHHPELFIGTKGTKIPNGNNKKDVEGLSSVIELKVVAEPTFLTVNRKASSRLVSDLLQALYEESTMVDDYELLTPEDIARWRAFSFHPTASEYFQKKRK